VNRLGRKLSQVSLGGFELWQLGRWAAVVELGGKLCLSGQRVTFDAIQHIAFEKNAETALLGLCTLTTYGEGLVPAVRMKQAANHGCAQHVTHRLAGHAGAQGLHLLT
jgi:hypothetical protein